ncbi:MAG: crosslink repair DNA glycosylase YcaQ family protein, partial [Pseudomonadota bacterium]
SGGWWDWHPSKTALEYHWRTGALAVTKREGFRKYYDLTERVLPASVLAERTEPAETLDWACNAALDRLAFASSGEIAAFWALASPAEAKDWCAAECAAGRIEEIEIGLADGSWRRSFARPGLVDGPVPELSGRLRILSPFDPALRDRKRAERLFGFSYRIEIFVPETKRTYGYYVFPILEGDRLVGRIDMKCARAEGCLSVRALWPEPGVKWGKLRHQKLLSELDRLGGLTGCRTVDFGPGWLRDP